MVGSSGYSHCGLESGSGVGHDRDHVLFHDFGYHLSRLGHVGWTHGLYDYRDYFHRRRIARFQ